MSGKKPPERLLLITSSTFTWPAFAGKSFDDFTDRMQSRFGVAAMTFRKKLTSDEQTFDHLEWPPAGDTTLWAIDETQFYGHFCLSVFQKSRGEELAQVRKDRASRKSDSSDLIDQITRILTMRPSSGAGSRAVTGVRARRTPRAPGALNG